MHNENQRNICAFVATEITQQICSMPKQFQQIYFTIACKTEHGKGIKRKEKKRGCNMLWRNQLYSSVKTLLTITYLLLFTRID